MAKKPSSPPSLPAPGIEAFMTRQRANDGRKIPLHSADGTLTAHWVLVRGVDSDEFQRAKGKQTRRFAEIASLPDDEREEAILDATLEMQASLVADWSFSDAVLMGTNAPIECTRERVKAFLREAPQIAREIDKLAARRDFFFKRE